MEVVEVVELVEVGGGSSGNLVKVVEVDILRYFWDTLWK